MTGIASDLPTLTPLHRHDDDIGPVLRSEAYLRQEVADWEVEHLFMDGWLCVGTLAQLSRPGRYLTVDYGLQSLLVVRDTDDRVRAFYNVCQHRGCPLVADAADSVSVLRCPYHGWTYQLDGRLRTAPFTNVLDRPDADRFGLTEIRTEVVEGLVFADPSGSAPDLGTQLGPIPAMLARYGVAELAIAARRTEEVTANWKLIAENLLECNHCPYIHPEYNDATDFRSAELSAGPGSYFTSRMTLNDGYETVGDVDSMAGRATLPGLSADERRYVHYLHFFPGLLIALQPDYVSIQWYHPATAERSRVITEWLVTSAEAVTSPPTLRKTISFIERILDQDWDVCSSVQRGLHSKGFRGGHFSTLERRSAAFDELIVDTYLNGQRSQGPRRPFSDVVDTSGT